MLEIEIWNIKDCVISKYVLLLIEKFIFLLNIKNNNSNKN